MPVDFPEAGRQPRPALFGTGNGRVVLVPEPRIFLGRCEAPIGGALKQGHIVDTVDDVLTYLPQRVDPAASGTPSCRHRNPLTEVIEILCLLNDGCHLR